MFDLAKYKAQQEHRKKLLQVYHLAASLKDIRVSGDEADFRLQDNHIREIILSPNYRLY